MSSSFTASAWDNFKQMFAAVILAIIIKTSIVEAYKIPSSSMEDTLLVGDFLLANKFVYGSRVPLFDWQLPAITDPERGDVVIFMYPRDGVTKYIKRCIGIPGDTIKIIDKVLYVNGQIVKRPEFSKFNDLRQDGSPIIQSKPPRDNYGPYVVPENCYFMMGDNWDNSWDSRFWGPVPKDYILGEALIIHWSWDDDQYRAPDISISDPLSVPRVFLYNAIHFFKKVRWDRLMHPIS